MFAAQGIVAASSDASVGDLADSPSKAKVAPKKKIPTIKRPLGFKYYQF
jgi:hypothetical protein